MPKSTLYVRCDLIRKLARGAQTQSSYLPEKFAVEGKVLRLKCDKTGEWTNGWIVKRTYGPAIPEPPDPHLTIKHHRKNTGDSTPRERCRGNQTK